jgi:hypothetical protein
MTSVDGEWTDLADVTIAESGGLIALSPLGHQRGAVANATAKTEITANPRNRLGLSMVSL